MANLISAVIGFFTLVLVCFNMNEARLFKLDVLKKKPVCEVEDRFLSLAFGIGQVQREFKLVNYSSEKLKTLLTALKPAYFRFGGSAANFLFFKVGSTKPPTPPDFPDETKSETENEPFYVKAETTKSPPSTPNILAGQENVNLKPTTATKKQTPKATPFTPNIPEKPTSSPNMPPAVPNSTPPIQTTRMPQNTQANPGTNQPNQPIQPGLGQQNPVNTLPNTPNENKSPYHYEAVNGRNDEVAQGNTPSEEDWKKDELFSGSGSASGNFDIESGDEIEKRDLIKRGKIVEPFWLMSDDFDKFYKLITDAGLDLIFNLGDFVRYGNGSWNATNALEMLNHVAYRQYKVGWQLGNEPNSYKKYGDERVISGKQDGEDVIELRKILRSNPKFGSLLVGPDITRPRKGSSSEQFLRDYLATNASTEVSAVSWHQYYVNGRTTSKEEMVSPDTLDLLKDQIIRVNQVMKETKTKKPAWLTETGSAWGGGAPGISDTFAASFMYLDKLGLAGVFCHSVVMRQSILSGKYAMLDDDYTPRPDYWLALLHKGLVGKKVLLISGDTKKLRAYTHCTKPSSKYPKGSITVMVMNLRKKPVRISFAKGLQSKDVDQFLVTSSDGSLTTKEVLLNGKKLQISSDNLLPDLAALKTKQPMKMPSYSYAFYVIPDANNPFCQ